MNPAPDHLRTIETSLYKQLVAMALLVLGLGAIVGGWQMGLSAAIGVVTAIFYYMMLGVQVRKQVAIARPPNLLAVILSLFGRQVICLAAPAACFFLIGQGWWASLITLVVARHWVMVAAHAGNTAPAPTAHA
jgi:hypothetical protein